MVYSYDEMIFGNVNVNNSHTQPHTSTSDITMSEKIHVMGFIYTYIVEKLTSGVRSQDSSLGRRKRSDLETRGLCRAVSVPLFDVYGPCRSVLSLRDHHEAVCTLVYSSVCNFNCTSIVFKSLKYAYKMIKISH